MMRMRHLWPNRRKSQNNQLQGKPQERSSSGLLLERLQLLSLDYQRKNIDTAWELLYLDPKIPKIHRVTHQKITFPTTGERIASRS